MLGLALAQRSNVRMALCAGSGKTHTMTGVRDDPQQRGINFRALEDLFTIRDQRSSEVGCMPCGACTLGGLQGMRKIRPASRGAGGGSKRPHVLTQ